MIFHAASQLSKFALLCAGAFVVLGTKGDRFYVEPRPQESSAAAQTAQAFPDSEAIDEAAESDDPSQRAFRAMKNARYDYQDDNRDLTNGEFRADTWHRSVDEALAQAVQQFGVQADEWKDVE